jgi:hypothetical protein
MRQQAIIEPRNSLLFISDIKGGSDPEQTGDHLLWTASSISITCYPWQDGPTKVTLCLSEDAELEGVPVLDGFIESPNREVMVSTVEWEVVLKQRVPDAHVRVRIWENHPKFPNDIRIVLG